MLWSLHWWNCFVACVIVTDCMLNKTSGYTSYAGYKIVLCEIIECFTDPLDITLYVKVKRQSPHISLSVGSQSPSYHVPDIFPPLYFTQNGVITIIPQLENLFFCLCYPDVCEAHTVMNIIDCVYMLTRQSKFAIFYRTPFKTQLIEKQQCIQRPLLW